MLLSGKLCKLWNNQRVQLRKITRHLYQQPQGLIIIVLLTSTQLKTMQRSQRRSLNDTMWNAMFSIPQYATVIITRGIKGSLIKMIGSRDTSTITPLWQWWWIPTQMLQEMMTNQYIPPENLCKLQVLTKNSFPRRWRKNCTRSTGKYTQFYENKTISCGRNTQNC